MKLLLLLLLALLPMTAQLQAGESQTVQALLEEKLDLEFDRHYVIDVADFLGKITGVKVVFPKAILDSDQEITLSVKAMPLREVFDAVAKQSGTTWKANGKRVIFSIAKR